VRPLEAFPVRRGDETVLGLRDPEELFEGVLLASPACAALLPLLDGTRDARAIATAWAISTGSVLLPERVESIVAELEERLVLEGPAADAARAAALAAYRARPAREAAHAGGAYPETTAECEAFLAGHVAAAAEAPVPAGVRAVIAPHIDLRGGGACHGAAARALARSPAETFVVLGTAHAPIRRPFALTARDHETPLGTVPVDRDVVARLAARGGGRLLDDELAHRGEHSVEFQALWLRRQCGDRPGLRIVPVLVGSLGPHLRGERRRDPLADPEIADFVGALRELADREGDRVAFVASVDLAHVGPRYGDGARVTPARRAEVLEADRGLLAHAAQGDPAGWLAFLRAERDARNVCGAAPVWALLATIEGRGWRGTLLRHDDWEIDADTGSWVSFAALAFAEPDGDAPGRAAGTAPPPC
jgi:AmmeMemoRadiSam system protein B